MSDITEKWKRAQIEVGAMAELKKRIAGLEAERDVLLVGISELMTFQQADGTLGHNKFCNLGTTGKCDCGYIEAVASLAELVTQAEDEASIPRDSIVAQGVDNQTLAAVALALSDRAAKLRADAEHYRRDWRITNCLQRATQAEALAEYNDDLAGRYSVLANGQRPAVLVCAKTSEASR